ncbi:uncharacterized protein LOC118511002 isoform X2 [Anopheles stephensi]|uniref:uncharacterized protein LOC118511002 isoform X2 n=1 Tax=Anopheles stephensi TaxID=30069 RepID=UPI001658AFF1|nr:uncharacterized protein LOC118511002 isoform X2 [Anopheles stephensi]
MVQDLDFISDINDKYAGLELELEEMLEAVVERERALDPAEVQISNRSNSKKSESANFSLERAERRNYELLKSLEISKARLRSRATFSPLEAILQKAIGSYLKETSLVPCSTKKLYGPTYV